MNFFEFSFPIECSKKIVRSPPPTPLWLAYTYTPLLAASILRSDPLCTFFSFPGFEQICTLCLWLYVMDPESLFFVAGNGRWPSLSLSPVHRRFRVYFAHPCVQESLTHTAFAQRRRVICVCCILEVRTRLILVKMAVHMHVLGTLG